MRVIQVICLALLTYFIGANTAAIAQTSEPSWTSRVIKRGDDRQATNSKDILKRPYRPMHFYGNTVRRRHYRGRARPTVRDVGATFYYVVRRQ